jgi:hypothetical protein
MVVTLPAEGHLAKCIVVCGLSNIMESNLGQARALDA